MKQQNSARSLRFLFSAALITALIIGMGPAQTALAQGTTSTSDLAVSLVSIPKHVKACDVFEATYTVTNLGPDPAYQMEVFVQIPDPYQDIAMRGVPASLAVGQTATFTVVIWVGGFVPGEIRSAHVEVVVYSNPYPDISVDPNLDNNLLRTPMRIISKHMQSCPSRP